MTTAVLSNYLENKIIDHVLRATAYTTPGTLIYVALYQTDPTDADAGAEVSGGNYARQQVTAWDDPGATRATQNTNAITFPTASASWGTVGYIGIRDAAAAGNLLFYGQLTTSKIIGINDTFSHPAGGIDVSLGGAFSNYLAGTLLSHILRNSAYASPGTLVYAALYQTDPTNADTGTEVTGGDYVRNQITAWDAASDGATQNTNEEAWAASSASWGTVVAAGVRDASAAGNLLFSGTLDASKIVASGDTFKFAAGALDISVS